MNLTYQQLSANDIDSLVEWLASDTWPYHADPQPDREKVREWIEKGFFIGEQDKTTWILLEGHAKVGLIHLYAEEDGELMLDVRVSKPQRGRGKGREAVKWVTNYVVTEQPELLRFQAITREDNRAMRRVLRRCGFVKEGHHRKAWPIGNGQYLDKIRYAVLQEDWEEKKVTPVRWNDEDDLP